MYPNHSRIIVALDGMTKQQALELVEQLAPHVWGFKVNDLLVQEGVEIIRELKGRGTNIFADPKIHDIPNTHANTVRKLVEVGADMITVHASAGMSALAASVKAADSSECKILCMMVPTSLDEASCQVVYGATINAVITRFTLMGLVSGVHGFICGPPDLKLMTSLLEGKTQELVVPGIRDKDSPPDDQNRKATAGEARTWGAHFEVIGRLITKAQNPAAKAMLLNKEIAEAAAN